MNIKHERSCPQCNSAIVYRKAKMLERGEKLKTLCRKCQNGKINPAPNTQCRICSKAIYRIPSRLKNELNFCSYVCRNKFYSDDKSFVWRGGRELLLRRQRIRKKSLAIEKKEKLVELMGGGCQKCGYNKCVGALDFHHINPATKISGIRGLICLSWKRLLKEIEKCILLCSNCHREHHWNENQKKRMKQKRKMQQMDQLYNHNE